MNSSANTTVPPSQCFWGSCTYLDLSTCTQVSRQENITTEPLPIDAEGCFSTNNLRATAEYQHFRLFSLVMGLLTIIIGSIGLVGNLASIRVLLSSDMRNCFNHLLVTLNTSDSFHIVFAILEVIRNDFPDIYNQILPHPALFPLFHYPSYRMSVCASIYLIIAVGVERYLAVCRPHHYREVQGRSNRVIIYILPALLAALAINITKFFEVETVEYCVDFRHCGCGIISDQYHKLTEMRLNKDYIIYFHLWTWIFVTGIIPFSILIVLNWKIYSSMKRLRQNLTRRTSAAVGIRDVLARTKQIGKASLSLDAGKDPVTGHLIAKKREKRVTIQSKECNLAMILICTVATFFFFHMPRLLTSVYEAATFHKQSHCTAKKLDYLPLWFLYSIVAMNVMLVVNASSNFCIYFFAGKLFRLNLMKLLGRKPNLSPKTNGMTTCREQSNGNYAEELKLKENKSDEHVCVGVKKAVDTTNTNVNLKVNECDPPRRHSSLLISRL